MAVNDSALFINYQGRELRKLGTVRQKGNYATRKTLYWFASALVSWRQSTHYLTDTMCHWSLLDCKLSDLCLTAICLTFAWLQIVCPLPDCKLSDYAWLKVVWSSPDCKLSLLHAYITQGALLVYTLNNIDPKVLRTNSSVVMVQPPGMS